MKIVEEGVELYLTKDGKLTNQRREELSISHYGRPWINSSNGEKIVFMRGDYVLLKHFYPELFGKYKSFNMFTKVFNVNYIDGDFKNYSLNNLYVNIKPRYLDDLLRDYRNAISEYFKEATVRQCIKCFKISNDFYVRKSSNHEGMTIMSKTCKKCEIKYNNKRAKKLRSNNPEVRLMESQRTRISSILRGKGYDKSYRTLKYLGCTRSKLIKHLESQFKDDMTWGNYGRKGWHVDHIIPLCSANSIDELLPLFHYTNLQPLWAKENHSKGGRII